MKRYVFADPATGKLHHQVIVCDEVNMKLNTPTGLVAIQHDEVEPSRFTYDFGTGQFKEITASPDSDKVWHEEQKRWIDSPTKSNEIHARHVISGLESQSLRNIREYLLGDASALDRLKVVDQKIAEHRARFSKK